FGSRLHEHAGSAVVGLDRVPQGAVVQLDIDHAAARVLHRLLDGDRHFTRLAITEADLAGAVADDGQRGKGELATTLDRLGHAVDGNQLFQHAVAVFAIVRTHFGCCPDLLTA